MYTTTVFFFILYFLTKAFVVYTPYYTIVHTKHCTTAAAVPVALPRRGTVRNNGEAQ